jgi:hypothetical protein
MGESHIEPAEPMTKWFAYAHLPEHLQTVSRRFQELALFVVRETQKGPQRDAALQRLLEAKDCAVRATLFPGG